MNYRIVDKDAYRIVGVMDRIPIVYSGENPAIAEVGAKLNEALIRRLKEMSDVEPHGLISGYANFSDRLVEEKARVDFYIGVATTKACPGDLAQLEVAPSTWAVFEVLGSSSEAQKVWSRIYSEWFPSSSYELNEGPELYWREKIEGKSSSFSDDERFRQEIWIPVTKKRHSR